MGRADLIGNGKHQLVPRWQPAGTGHGAEGRRDTRGRRPRPGTALTQHTGLPPMPGTFAAPPAPAVGPPRSGARGRLNPAGARPRRSAAE